jgi:hypothetical protein
MNDVNLFLGMVGSQNRRLSLHSGTGFVVVPLFCVEHECWVTVNHACPLLSSRCDSVLNLTSLKTKRKSFRVAPRQQKIQTSISDPL